MNNNSNKNPTYAVHGRTIRLALATADGGCHKGVRHQGMSAQNTVLLPFTKRRIGGLFGRRLVVLQVVHLGLGAGAVAVEHARHQVRKQRREDDVESINIVGVACSHPLGRIVGVRVRAVVVLQDGRSQVAADDILFFAKKKCKV